MKSRDKRRFPLTAEEINRGGLPIFWGAKDIELLLRSQGANMINRDVHVYDDLVMTAEVTGWGFWTRGVKQTEDITDTANIIKFTNPVPNGKARWYGPLGLNISSVTHVGFTPVIIGPGGGNDEVYPLALIMSTPFATTVRAYVGVGFLGVVLPEKWNLGFAPNGASGNTATLNARYIEL